MEPSYAAALPPNTSSLICVKNLPKYVAEDRLRDFFSQKGEVTDATLMRTKDGKSRQFGFVGFRTEHEVQEALKYFDKSFMDTCIISCEIARKVGDANMPRPWSRYSLKKHDNPSESERRETGPNASKTVASEAESKKNKPCKKADASSDPQFHEFLQVMQHRSKSKLWANDTVAAPLLEQSVELNNKVKMTKVPGAKSDSEDVELEEHEEEGNEFLEKQEADKSTILAHDDALSDMDYYKSKIKKASSDLQSSSDEGSAVESEHSDEDDDSDDGTNSQEKSYHGHGPDTLESNVVEGEAEDGSPDEHGNIDTADPSSSRDEEELLETGCLFIRNLPYTATEEDLEAHFINYGSISRVHIVVDHETKRFKGFAYVHFALPESAARALKEMDNSIFQGRLLHVMPAKQKNVPDKAENNNDREQFPKTFKQKRNEERKSSEASGNTRAWNSLFMRSDTVVENIARKFGASKTELLDRESNDLAVRIALGETQVIAETKKSLTSAGVNIASLEEFAAGKTDGQKRSNHIILVKNLPYGSSESELVDMFGKFGSLDKVILPPTKTLALVIFLERTEARSAFKGLSYKRYRDGPLFLEWAPDNILSQTPVVGDNAVAGEFEVKRALLEQQAEQMNEDDIDHDRIESRSLYVKNLNFRTSDEAVKKHFSENMKGGKLQSVRVKKHLKNGKNVSMGFGFVEFDSVDTAMNVCRNLQGTVLDGHALILQLCHAKKDEVLPKKVDQDRSSTKLIVRNVAFEAIEKDPRQLFSPFGQANLLQILPPVEFCCIYGSSLHPNNSDKASMVDYILGVNDPHQWHAQNLEMNRGHYASWMVRLGGASLINRVADGVGVGVHFNPFVSYNHRMFKYGVVGMNDLVQDIQGWERFYLSGRLQKPVNIIVDNLHVEKLNSVNLKAAIAAALLLLPSNFSEEELYAKICSLSYMGDLRMLFAEDKNKVKNIVQGQFKLFQTMYQPLIEEFAERDLCRLLPSADQKVNIVQDCGLSTTFSLVAALPLPLRSQMEVDRGEKKVDVPVRDAQKVVITSKEGAAECVRRILRRKVMVSSTRQAVAGFLTSGAVHGLRYLGKKMHKAWKSWS